MWEYEALRKCSLENAMESGSIPVPKDAAPSVTAITTAEKKPDMVFPVRRLYFVVLEYRKVRTGDQGSTRQRVDLRAQRSKHSESKGHNLRYDRDAGKAMCRALVAVTSMMAKSSQRLSTRNVASDTLLRV